MRSSPCRRHLNCGKYLVTLLLILPCQQPNARLGRLRFATNLWLANVGPLFGELIIAGVIGSLAFLLLEQWWTRQVGSRPLSTPPASTVVCCSRSCLSLIGLLVLIGANLHRSQSSSHITDRGPGSPRFAKRCPTVCFTHPSRSKRASNHFKRFAFSTTGDTQSMAFRTDTRHPYFRQLSPSLISTQIHRRIQMKAACQRATDDEKNYFY